MNKTLPSEGFDKTKLKTLQNWNLACFVVHLVTCIIFVGLFFAEWSSTNDSSALKGIRTSTFVTVPVFDSGALQNSFSDLTVQQRQRMAETSGLKAVQRVADSTLTLPFLIVAFSFITSMFHLWNWLDMKTDKKFETGEYGQMVLGKACNYRRWLEYAITATVMVIIVALSFGLRELYALILIASVVPAIMYMGHLFEKSMHRWANKVRKNQGVEDGNSTGSYTDQQDAKFSTLLGWVLLFVVFGVLMASLWNAVQTVDEFRKELDERGDEETFSDFGDFKVLIILSGVIILVFYMLFGLVQVIDFYKCSNSKTYLVDEQKRGCRNEIFYCGLSASSKVLLIVLLGWGLFGRSRNNE